MHIRVSIACKGIDLIDKNDDFSKLLAKLPHLCELCFALSIILAHDGFCGNVDERDVDLLGDDFCTCGLSCARRSLK